MRHKIVGDFMNEYELLFKQLKIEISPLPDDYSHDNYGYQLKKDSQPHTEIAYSVFTQLKSVDKESCKFGAK